MDEIRLIVGLGNPGEKYERTRHNAGYWWVDAIAARKRASWKKETKFSGWTTKVEEGGREFFLLKPSTYMNESGRSVSSLMRFFKIEPAQLLVVHDELDLLPGVVKLKRGGGIALCLAGTAVLVGWTPQPITSRELFGASLSVIATAL